MASILQSGLPVANEAAPRGASRLGWLDVARGLAAIIVYIQHSLERDIPAFSEWSWNWVNFGRVGVTTFFLVSGFVIPFSLERSGSLKKFWVGRFYRLYPLYWFAFIAVVSCAYLGHVFVEQGFDWRSPLHLGVNATMVQQLVRVPNALPVFWTLGLEMLFYWIVSLAFLFKFNSKSTQLLYGVCAAVVLAAVGAALVLNRPFPGIGAMFLVVTACYGTVFFRYMDGKLNAKSLASATACVVLVLAVLSTVAYRFSSGAHGTESELISPTARIGSAVVGYALFFGVFMFREASMPKFLTHLGIISYSVYLIHPFVWHFLPRISSPYVTVAVGFALTVLISTLTYRWIEAPFQALGRKVVKRMGRRTEVQPTQHESEPSADSDH